MTDERYKAIMADLGMPNSRSLLVALQQVTNEAGQECAASEREACAKACEAEKIGTNNDDHPVDRAHDAALDGAIKAIRKRSNVKVSGAGTASAGLPGSAAPEPSSED